MFNREMWRAILGDTWRVARRHPWMLTPAVWIWRVTTTAEERDRFITAASAADEAERAD